MEWSSHLGLSHFCSARCFSPVEFIPADCGLPATTDEPQSVPAESSGLRHNGDTVEADTCRGLMRSRTRPAMMAR